MDYKMEFINGFINKMKLKEHNTMFSTEMDIVNEIIKEIIGEDFEHKQSVSKIILDICNTHNIYELVNMVGKFTCEYYPEGNYGSDIAVSFANKILYDYYIEHKEYIVSTINIVNLFDRNDSMFISLKNKY